jgi:protein TonB
MRGFEPDDPDLEIPHGALQNSIREAPERHFQPHHDGAVTHTAAEPLAPARVVTAGRKTTLSIVASFLFHAAIAAAFLCVAGEEVLIEGADFTGVAVLGEGADQVKAGEISDLEDNAVEVTMVTMLDAKPVETVKAEAVPVEETAQSVEIAEAVTEQPESVQPVTEAPAEQVTESRTEAAVAPQQPQVAQAEPQQPVEAQPAPAEAAESAPARAVTEILPEVLATDLADKVDDDNFVPKPAETQAAEPVEAAETAPAQPSETATELQDEAASTPSAQPAEREVAETTTARSEPSETSDAQSADAVKAEQSETPTAEPAESSQVETTDVARAEPAEAQVVEAGAIDTPDEAPRPEFRPEPKPPQMAEQKRTEQPAERKAAKQEPPREAPKKEAAEKQPTRKTAEGKTTAEKAKPRQTRAGNGGQNEANARRGEADGQENGDSRQASRGGSKNGQVGNAAISNYPGKVRSKLARVARSVRAKGRGEVVVAFAVGSNGNVRGARVARSSGDASVDQAALQAVQKAAPFPPIPEGAGRSSWEFSVPLAFRR